MLQKKTLIFLFFLSATELLAAPVTRRLAHAKAALEKNLAPNQNMASSLDEILITISQNTYLLNQADAELQRIPLQTTPANPMLFAQTFPRLNRIKTQLWITANHITGYAESCPKENQDWFFNMAQIFQEKVNKIQLRINEINGLRTLTLLAR